MFSAGFQDLCSTSVLGEVSLHCFYMHDYMKTFLTKPKGVQSVRLPPKPTAQTLAQFHLPWSAPPAPRACVHLCALLLSSRAVVLPRLKTSFMKCFILKPRVNYMC